MNGDVKFTRDEAIAVVEAAIKIAGSSGKLASKMGRDERQVRRWRSGEQDVPAAAFDWLEEFIRTTANA